MLELLNLENHFIFFFTKKATHCPKSLKEKRYTKSIMDSGWFENQTNEERVKLRLAKLSAQVFPFPIYVSRKNLYAFS